MLQFCNIQQKLLRGLTRFLVTTKPMSVKPVETSIKSKLTSGLQPVHLEVINESSMHGVPPGSETHFKVVVVSDSFENVGILQRHRMVNNLLEDELKTSVHALSIMAKTPKQWQESDQIVTPSPNCRGGFGK